MEAFVDAAFAFAVTLLAVSIDSVPSNREELIETLKGVPAFACSFTVICLFWWDHNTWSRRFGLDDGHSTVLSLVYIGTALVFVYPLKSMFSSMWAFLSDGFLPSTYQVESIDDLRWMFGLYAAAFVSLGWLSFMLKRHAWRQRDKIGLDAIERLCLQREFASSYLHMGVGVASLFAALSLSPGWPQWAYSLPGALYSLLGFHGWINAHYQRKVNALSGQGAS
nr:TMEM175 family protein [Pseudomarimonas arenosa]